ncbi:MAG: aminopeptidase [Deltaproteobacteria bacterium]|nr:aminopeptidase [Deltaproteobacteria bacterium]
MDPRIIKLADNLVNYCLKVKTGDKVLVEAFGATTHLLVEKLIELISKAGGAPFYLIHDNFISRVQKLSCTMEQMELEAKWQCQRMNDVDCYIGVRGFENVLEQSDVPAENLDIYSRTVWNKVHSEIRVPKKRWVILRYPNPCFAQTAKMSTRAFEDFFFDACTMDYATFSKDMDPLVTLMNQTDRVHIKGKGTDLTFSIKNIPAIKCDGLINIPDGEIYTAPIKNSINGTSFCNTPTIFEGNLYDGISLKWKNGQIVAFDCEIGDKAKLEAIFNRDEGARYVGEFAIGCNPHITREMLDTLFDEKIAGSFHLTPGSCYDNASNGNTSRIHWDMVYRQFPENGGGEIYFDDVLVRKDGLFVIDALKNLNPKGIR